MAIATTDKFLHVGNPGTATTLSSPGYTIGNTSITVASSTNFPTDTAVIFSIDTAATTTGSQVRNQNSYCVFVGIVTGAQTIGSLQLLYGTPQNFAASALTRVYITISAVYFNRLIDGILLFANQDGSLKQSAVKAALGVSSTTGGGWDILNAGTAPTVASGYNKGNKEYTLTFNGVDLTSTLSAGMRLKFDRGTTAPTQSMSFTAASSQYATKASPTGITFTSAFTCEAWVYLNSYGNMGLITRDSGTSGFGLKLTSSGQVGAFYSGGSGYTEVDSYQSIPLKRWVHVAASVSSVSTKTVALYINGVSVPGPTSSSAATTLTQAGSLQLGADNSTAFFDGYISEARVWGVAQTQTQIQDNMAISLTGSETNLVALFQGNGNFTDKTANANTLTATGGAIATQAANPYNTTEYAIVTKVAYATSTTTVTVFTGTDYNIPLGTLINPFSSFQRAPFGFPASRGKWTVSSLYRVGMSQNSAVQSTWYYTNAALYIPTGDWSVSIEGQTTTASASGGACDIYTTLATVTAAETNTLFTTRSLIAGVSGTPNLQEPFSKSNYETLTAQTPYYLNYKTGQTSNSAINIDSPNGACLLQAECAYL